MLPIILILSYFLIHSALTTSDKQLNINLKYEDNNTFLLFYNLTTNYSYYITIRSFGDVQLKYGLYSPTNKSQEYLIKISHQYETEEFFYLFIICFHFLIPLNNLDIQCKDIRLFKTEEDRELYMSKDFLPSYNPLFVPMMYALSVLMLLPVIIQHHRRKKFQSIRRRKELRRLSVSIASDKRNPKRNIAQRFLSQFVENGNINYKTIPSDIELVSIPSTKNILNDTEENPNVTFTIQNFVPYAHQYDEIDLNEETNVDAHDCIAHLLDNTPWNTPDVHQPFSSSLSRRSVIHDSATAIKEQHVPTIGPFHIDNDDRKPILKSQKYSVANFYSSKRNFLESDV